jgi:hypothetical protein
MARAIRTMRVWVRRVRDTSNARRASQFALRVQMNTSVRDTSLGLWLLSMAMGASAAQAAPIRAHQPLLEPMLVHAGGAQGVRLTTFVNRGAAQVARIEVYEHDERDRPTRYMGQLNDQGLAGDLRANDQWYAATLDVELATPGLRRYSVALTIDGERDTLWSAPATLEALPREVVLGSTPPRFERELIDPETEATLACDGVLVYYAKGMPYAEIDAQPPSVHGFAIALLPRLGSVVHAYEVSFHSDLRTFDAYNAQGGFFDLFAMTLGPRYFDQPLVDDVRPQLNSYFTAGGAFRIDSSVPIQVGSSDTQTVGLASTAPVLNVVLDTRAPAQVDAQFPSWGTVTIEDITPPRFE